MGGERHGAQAFDLHSAMFSGVENAEQIRELVLDRLRRVKGAGLGDHEDEHADAALGQAHAAGRVEILRAMVAEASALRTAAQG